jgi:zinc transporter ZupT
MLYLAGTALLPQIREEGTGKQKLVSFLMILIGVGIMALLLLIE